MCSMCCPFNTIKDRACFIDKCFKIEMTRATTQAIRNQILGMAAGGTPLIIGGTSLLPNLVVATPSIDAFCALNI